MTDLPPSTTDLSDRETRGMLIQLLFWSILVPLFAVAVTWLFFDSQGRTLTNKEWKLIILITWIGTTVGHSCLLLRKRK